MISRRRFTLLLAGVGLEVCLGLPQRSSTSSDLTILSTSDWGAEPPLAPIQVLERLPKGIIIHHSARLNSVTTTRERAIAVAQAIQYGHFDRGWIDTGQHFTVSRGGWVLEGRHGSLAALNAGTRMVVGTHTPAANDTHIGIECEGTYTAEEPPAALWESLIQLCALICRRYDLVPEMIAPHRNWTSTECPGAALTALFPQLHGQVRDALAAARSNEWPILELGMWRRQVRTCQELLRHAGYHPPATNRFDAATKAVVEQFQAAQHLPITGVIGPRDWPLLVTPLAFGDQGPAVVALHVLLRLPLTGRFDSETETALQAAIGRVTCDEAGWRSLVIW